MKFYERIPELISAEQLNKDNAEELARLCGGQVIVETDPRDTDKKYTGLNVPTLSGVRRMSEGQWLIKQVDGSWNIMGPSAFKEMFREI